MKIEKLYTLDKKEGEGGREEAQTMYTHVSKCKNDKKKDNKEFSIHYPGCCFVYHHVSWKMVILLCQKHPQIK
jgi:hypothetical protein